jgi:hypothetical protein
MMADRATDGSAQQRVMTGDMAGHASNSRARKTTRLRTRNDCKTRAQSKNEVKSFHERLFSDVEF